MAPWQFELVDVSYIEWIHIVSLQCVVVEQRILVPPWSPNFERRLGGVFLPLRYRPPRSFWFWPPMYTKIKEMTRFGLNLSMSGNIYANCSRRAEKWDNFIAYYLANQIRKLRILRDRMMIIHLLSKRAREHVSATLKSSVVLLIPWNFSKLTHCIRIVIKNLQ